MLKYQHSFIILVALPSRNVTDKRWESMELSLCSQAISHIINFQFTLQTQFWVPTNSVVCSFYFWVSKYVLEPMSKIINIHQFFKPKIEQNNKNETELCFSFTRKLWKTWHISHFQKGFLAPLIQSHWLKLMVSK